MEYNTKKTGNYGENVIKGYLYNKGYDIILQNYKANGYEIDIIAKQKEYIVFIEVKYRKSLKFGRPLEAITHHKIKHIINCAYAYLAEYNISDTFCRFDVIEVFGKEFLTINHIENAFGEY